MEKRKEDIKRKEKMKRKIPGAFLSRAYLVRLIFWRDYSATIMAHDF